VAGPVNDSEISHYLVDLLTHQRGYRRRWEREVLRRPSAAPNQAAVARVVAEYLVETGERRDSFGLHRQIKDRIARVFAGRGVSTETLRWVIGAFAMSDYHATRLWEIFDGSKRAGFVAGEWPPPSQRSGDQGCHTVSLHEFHTIGPDGCPASHRTVQVVRATTDGLSCYLYRFDTQALDVKVARGGQAGPVQDLGQGIHGVEIVFNSALLEGETASLEYLTTFRYERPPPPEFRRAVIRRVDNLEMRIQFHPRRPPARIWWGSWRNLEDPPFERELLKLDAELATHRYLDGVEQAIVGFVWDWHTSD
jgi:hypothetical protein